MDVHENAVTIGRIDERLTDLAGNYKSLSKSYKILNDTHIVLEEKFTVMETEWKIAKTLLSWVAGGSFVSLIIGALTLAKLFNVI